MSRDIVEELKEGYTIEHEGFQIRESADGKHIIVSFPETTNMKDFITEFSYISDQYIDNSDAPWDSDSQVFFEVIKQ